MDRRGFLSSLAAGTAVLMLPSLATTAQTISITTASDLTAWASTHFVASTGPARSFFELPVAEAMRRYGKLPINEGDEIFRFTYVTLAIGVEGDDPVEAERRLVQAMYERLSKAEKNQPLIWRVEPQFLRDEIIEFGDTWMNREEIEDRADIPYSHGETEWMKKTHDRHLVQWKFSPPNNKIEQPINVPDGVEYDFGTESLRYVKRKYTLNKLRMRVALPTVMSENFAGDFFVQNEGSTTVRI